MNYQQLQEYELQSRAFRANPSSSLPPEAVELMELRSKYDAACLLMHQNEVVIRRLELIVDSSLQPQPLVADATTDTSLDFGYDGQHGGRSPHLQVAQLLAVLANEEARLQQERQSYIDQVGAMTQESLGLLRLLGKYESGGSRPGGKIGPMKPSSAAGVPLTPSFPTGQLHFQHLDGRVVQDDALRIGSAVDVAPDLIQLPLANLMN